MPDAERALDDDATEAAGPGSSRAEALLLDFLRDHDADCPVCGYSLRALTRPVCPECRQDLVLTVGVTRLRMGWLFVAIAPGFFSGIASCFVAVPTVGIFVEDDTVVPPLAAAVLFGWASGIFAIVLARRRHRFLAQSRSRQRWFALVVWLVHVAAFVLFVGGMLLLV